MDASRLQQLTRKGAALALVFLVWLHAAFLCTPTAYAVDAKEICDTAPAPPSRWSGSP